MSNTEFDRGYAVGLATRESVVQLREQRDRQNIEVAKLRTRLQAAESALWLLQDKGLGAHVQADESVAHVLLAALLALRLHTHPSNCWCLGGGAEANHDETCVQAQAAIARATGGTP